MGFSTLKVAERHLRQGRTGGDKYLKSKEEKEK